MNKCLECNIDIKETLKFCGRKCSVIHNNKLRKTKCSDCLNCNTSLRGTLKGRKFCSKKCEFIYKNNSKILLIENNVNLSPRILKAYLIKKYGNKCMKCNWNEVNKYTGNVPIELEHKDGNSENNILDNLELLCPNCHSLTSTYKALNIGNGRYKRKQRFKEGKSF